MRTAFRTPVRVLFLSAAILTAACASTPEASSTTPPGGGSAAATGGSVVTLDNNLSAMTAVTVFLEPESGGVRQSLGVIDAGASKSLPMTVQRGWYILVAQRPTGDLRSDRFQVPGPSTIAWDMQFNRVRVTAR
jgi:hypothetical protein